MAENSEAQLHQLMYRYITSSLVPNTSQLKQLLSQVSNKQRMSILSKEYTNYWMPLHKAAFKDDTDIIEAILSSLQNTDRIKLASISVRGVTPLQLAINFANIDSVKAILVWLRSNEQILLLNTKERSRQITAFLTAVSTGHVELTKTILDCLTPEKQVELITTHDRSGRTAIEEAESRGHSHVVTLLNAYSQEAELCLLEQSGRLMFCWEGRRGDRVFKEA